MKLELLIEGVYELRTGTVNSYIIDGDSGVTLVDTQVRGREDAIAQNLRALGRTLDDVTAILLTHSHTDHTGSAAAGRSGWSPSHRWPPSSSAVRSRRPRIDIATAGTGVTTSSGRSAGATARIFHTPAVRACSVRT